MRHPDPDRPPDRTPIKVGEVWENPVTGEHATILELPWENRAGRVTAELTAFVGARVMGEHHHPALVERFTPVESELTVKRNGQTSVLHQGETAVMEPGVWHDWWNASDRDARVRLEITPGERFAHMIETFFGLARLGHTDSKGMPYPLQLALCAREFRDVIVFRSPPLVVQRAIFALAPIARWHGYRATYPQLSHASYLRRGRSTGFKVATASLRLRLMRSARMTGKPEVDLSKADLLLLISAGSGLPLLREAACSPLPTPSLHTPMSRSR